MKKLLLTIVMGGAALLAYGQGAVNMNTLGSGAVLRFSNTVTRAWADTSVNVALYWGADAANVTNMVSTFATVATTPAAQVGYVVSSSGGGERLIPGRGNVDTYFQLRAWTGNYASWQAAYDAAVGGANVLVTMSTPVVMTSPVDRPTNPTTPAKQIPWGGTSASPLYANLVPVPEPSVIALGVLGLLGTLFIRRRK